MNIFFVVSIILMMAQERQSLALTNKAVKMAPTALSQSGTLTIKWFRLTDLRLHDNPSLFESIKKKRTGGILPVFCFDPRTFGPARSTFGTSKCGPRRAKFILESVADLRNQLQSKGSNLVVAYGKPENILLDIISTANVNKDKMPIIFSQEEVCPEELAIDEAVQASIETHHPAALLQKTWGSTLYDIKDLPYQGGVSDIPSTFTPFRNKVEKNCAIGRPLPVPREEDLKTTGVDFNATEKCSFTFMPTLVDLGYTEDEIKSIGEVDNRGVMQFLGGESQALARLNEYIWDKDLLKVYFDTRNGMLGSDYSTKFSPWLAHGCLSPRFIANECKNYEQERVANKSTYWVVFELLWRDFFKLFALKHGGKIFLKGGTINSEKTWGYDDKKFQAWKGGRTGFPLVDANMKELLATGFMSNRGRQNVCSFFALDLDQDWRYGADYFESTLLDYDVHSNWGNWCSGAGMTGGRLNRFNIVKQSKDYDQHGDYVRHWLPELKHLPIEFVHEPWKMTENQQTEYNCRLGKDYPHPIIPPFYPEKRVRKDREREKPQPRGGNNKNRGRGQRQDMKSLPKGNIQLK